MKKRITALIITLNLALSLAACGVSDNEGDYNPPTPTNSITEPPTANNTTDSSEQAQQAGELSGYIPPEIIYTSYGLTKFTQWCKTLEPFSEDRAWVKFFQGQIKSTGLIDNYGDLLFHIDKDLIYSSPFKDGLSYSLVSGKPNYTYFIIDSSGNILNSNMNGENNYVLLGYADGHFIVLEHITNFDTNEWRLGTIDEHGNIKNELRARLSVKVESGLGMIYNTANPVIAPQYEGDGVINIHPNIFYNVRTDEVINVDINLYSEGLRFNSNGYYDSNGLVIGFPEYEGRQFSGAPFNGGYAVMYVRGVDNYYYVTVIDKTGNRLFEPIKTDYNNTYADGLWTDIINSSQGYFITSIDGERVVVFPDSKTLKVGVDDLSIIGNDISFNNISNGFIMTNTEYISLDGKTIISSVNLPSEVQIVDEFILPPSSYTGSFNMAGMWKSSSGTILSFNANGTVAAMFFGFESGPDGSWSISSKTDENGHYILQASHITGGNPIYKVRLLSKDEIELYEESGVSFGSSYYHLNRQ
jgi:hypothetical protein